MAQRWKRRLALGLVAAALAYGWRVLTARPPGPITSADDDGLADRGVRPPGPTTSADDDRLTDRGAPPTRQPRMSEDR
jgi:hypothetical protein